MKERPGKGKTPRTETSGDPASTHPEAVHPGTGASIPDPTTHAAEEHAVEHRAWESVPADGADAAREAELSSAAAGVETPADAPAEAWPPTPPPEPPAPEPATAERSRASFAWALAVLVLVLIALGASPFWAPIVTAALPWGPNAPQGDNPVAQQLQGVDQRLSALEHRPAPPANGAGPAVEQLNQRIAQLSQKVDQLEQRPAGSGQGAAVDLAPLQAELRRQATSLGDVANKVGALENRVGQQPQVDPRAIQALQGDLQKLSVNVADLSNRLGKLETQEAAQAGIGRVEQALMLALGQLREAVRSGRPYTAELATVKSLARDRQDVLQAVQPLEASAAAGVPTLPVLTQRFRTTANEIVHAERPPPSEGWGDQILARVRSLVTIRRVGGNAGDDPVQNAVATAEGALDKADLAGAVQALDGLGGAPAEAAKPWLDRAHARLAAEAALDKVDTTIVARLAQGNGGSAGTSSGARSAQ